MSTAAKTIDFLLMSIFSEIGQSCFICFCVLVLPICKISSQGCTVRRVMKESVCVMNEFTLVAPARPPVCERKNSFFFSTCHTLYSLVAVVYPTVSHMHKVHTFDSKSHDTQRTVLFTSVSRGSQLPVFPLPFTWRSGCPSQKKGTKYFISRIKSTFILFQQSVTVGYACGCPDQ